MASNLIKWWDVSFGDARKIGKEEDGYITDGSDKKTEEPEEMSIDDLSSKERKLAMNILNENSNKNAFNDAKTILENEERNEQLKKEQESLEIYERLMREAAEDEAKKQAQIDEARRLADESFAQSTDNA